MSIVRIRYYTETVVQIFKTYTETRMRCYIGIISRILSDLYGVNKREYGLHVFSSLYAMIYGNVIQKICRKNLFCIQAYSVRIQDNTVKKTPHIHSSFM